MKLRELRRARSQRKARKRYEQEKAQRDAANDPKAVDRVKGAAGMGGGMPSGGGG